MKNIVIIGVGRFGLVIAKKLSKQGHEVLIIDQDEVQVKKASNYVTHAVQADCTDTQSLQTLGINQFDIGIVGIGKNLYSNIAAAHILKKFGVPYIVAKAKDDLHGQILNTIGVNKVVYPERAIGNKVVQELPKESGI